MPGGGNRRDLFAEFVGPGRLGFPDLRRRGTPRDGFGVEPRGDDRHLQSVAHGIVVAVAEDDVSIRSRRILDILHGRGRILEPDLPAQDVDQDGLAAVNVDVFQQRRTDGRLGRLDRTVLSLGPAGAHHRLAHALHNGAHIGEIEIHVVVAGDDFVNAAGRLVENVVRDAEGFLHGRVRRDDFQQPLVGNQDQGIDGFLELFDTLQGLGHADLALESERLGDDADGQSTLVAGNVRDDRCRPRTCAPAHAGCHKNHIGPFKGRCDLVTVFQGGGFPPGRITARAEPLGELGSDLHGLMGLGILEGLQVGVDGDELDPGQTGFDHPPDSVPAGSSDSRHLDISQTFDFFSVFKHHATRLLLELGK